MARLARLAGLVVPGLPHHVTQRGNRRGQTFFEDGDYKLYRNNGDSNRNDSYQHRNTIVSFEP